MKNLRLSPENEPDIDELTTYSEEKENEKVSTLQNTVYLVAQPETEQNEPGPYILQCADWYAMPMDQYEKSEC